MPVPDLDGPVLVSFNSLSKASQTLALPWKFLPVCRLLSFARVDLLICALPHPNGGETISLCS